MLQCLSWLWWTIRNYVFYTRLRTYTLEYVCIFLSIDQPRLDGIGALGFIRWVSPLNTWDPRWKWSSKIGTPLKTWEKNWHPGFQWHLHMHPFSEGYGTMSEINDWASLVTVNLFLDSLISQISRINSTGIQCFGPLNQSNAMFWYIYIYNIIYI